MNRRFRLRALERLRTGKLADAARVLGLARREMSQAAEQRTQVQAELLGCGATGTGPGTHFAMTAASSRRERLREDLLKAGERLSAAQGRELTALAGWTSARSDLRAVESLHQRHREALAEADARTEQRTLDELAAGTRRVDLGSFDPAEDPFDPAEDRS